MYTHLFEWASLPCSKMRGFKKEVEYIVPANGAFIRPVSLWGALPSRGDCRSLGWILVPLVGCISLEISLERSLRTMAARAGCGGRHVCLAEHPTPKVVTDNLDNFSNRGDSHRLSIPSSPQDEATLTLSGAPTLPCRGYRGYRSYRLPKRPPVQEETGW